MRSLRTNGRWYRRFNCNVRAKPKHFTAKLAKTAKFTGTAFVGVVQQHGIQLSMDGKGSWRDNLFIERLWKSVKYEEVYLHAYDSVTEARHGLARYFTFYNQGRPPLIRHQLAN